MYHLIMRYKVISNENLDGPHPLREQWPETLAAFADREAALRFAVGRGYVVDTYTGKLLD